MDALNPESERRLQAVMRQARELVPYGAPVVAIPTMRTRHAVAAVQGEVLTLALASYAFSLPQYGGYARMDNPWLLVVDGTLVEAHLQDLLPWMEQAAKDGAQLVVAAADYDDTMLAMFIVNRQRETLGVAALAADDPADLAPLRRLAQLAQVPPATVDGGRLRIERLGTLPSLLMSTRETVVVGGPGAQPVAIIHAGGESPEDVSAAVSRLRAMR
jgi:hypothetical protein